MNDETPPLFRYAHLDPVAHAQQLARLDPTYQQREPLTLTCTCGCHDGPFLCGFAPCCRHACQRRVVYPDRPPSAASTPFAWQWSDRPRIVRPAFCGGDAMQIDVRWAGQVRYTTPDEETP